MRKYLPTLGELIDRLTIVQLKEVKIPQHKKEYQTKTTLSIRKTIHAVTVMFVVMNIIQKR